MKRMNEDEEKAKESAEEAMKRDKEMKDMILSLERHVADLETKVSEKIYINIKILIINEEQVND